MWNYLVKKIIPKRPGKEISAVHAPAPVVSAARERRVDREKGDETSVAEKRTPAGKIEVTPKRQLHCPVCATEMQIVNFDRVEIDQCPHCGGIFLDKGELKAITHFELSSYEPGIPEKKILIYTPHGMTDHVRPQEQEK